MICLSVLFAVALGQTAPEITADGGALTLTGETITFSDGASSTTVTELKGLSYDKATIDEMFQELRQDVQATQDVAAAKITSLESLLATANAELLTAEQQRAEMAGKLRLLRLHADSDCRHAQYYSLDEEKCHDCDEDPARFYSALLDECMQCSEVVDRTLNDNGECELLTPCAAGQYISKKPTDTSPQVCSALRTCEKGEFESAAPGRGSDRECATVTECTVGATFETSGPTAFADRQCQPVSPECDSTTSYEAMAPEYSSDRVCSDVSPACKNSKELQAPTKTSDRVCEKIYETCKDVLLQNPGAESGVFTLAPASLGGEKVEAYCKNDVAGGGWTMIGKIGSGDWSRLSDDAYWDLVLNINNNVNPTDLLNEETPVPGTTMAFFNKQITDALGASAIAASKNVVFLIKMYGTFYLQVRVAPDKDWSVFRAIRDMTYWSSDADTYDYSSYPNINNYGKDFRISDDLDSINFDTNLFRQSTCGDNSVGFWWKDVVRGIVITKHGGLLGDGHCDRQSQWAYTLDQRDGRFKKDDGRKRVTIYMR